MKDRIPIINKKCEYKYIQVTFKEKNEKGEYSRITRNVKLYNF